MDDCKKDQQITVVVGCKQATFPRKILSSKLQYFEARLSENWNNNESADKIIISAEPIFDLHSFRLLLSNINESRQFTIPKTLDPDELLTLMQCANFFAILNNDDLLKNYYNCCTKVITNAQLQKWIKTKIRVLSVWASKQLKQRKSQAFQTSVSKLQSICKVVAEFRGSCYFCSEYCPFDDDLHNEFQYVLSLLKKTMDFSSGHDLESTVAQLHPLVIALTERNCDRNCHGEMNITLLMWLLNIRNHGIRSQSRYVQCVLLLINACKNGNYGYAYDNWWGTNQGLLVKKMWAETVVGLIQANYPNVIKQIVAPTWERIRKQSQLVQKIFNAVNNQQGHALALHIIKVNVDKSEYTKLYEGFCSKYCY